MVRFSIRLRGGRGRKPGKPRPGYERFVMKEPGIASIPQFGKISQVDVKYPLMEPFAFAGIKWDPEGKKLLYRVLEPEITPEENSALVRIENGLSELIDVKISSVKDTQEIIDYIQEKAGLIIKETGLKLTQKSYGKVMYYIVRDFIGLNEIEPMMHDPYIEDIGCTGLDAPVYIIHRKFGSIETGLVYRDFERLSNFVIKIAERCGRYISYATPLLDGTLPDGSRVQASLARDITTKGPTFSIRKFRRNPFSVTDLVNMNTASAELMAYLWLLIEYGASVMICGGVSTGKTSLLNVLSMFIPREEKIISIEDTREINLPHENWIPSVSRAGFGIPGPTGKRYGEVDLFDLLKESFRQNPDYVIVGEVRGKEAYVLFQGMASGHPSIGTIHAGSIEDVMKRLESPPIELSPSLVESLDALIVMVNAKEKGKSARRVKEIVEVQGVDQKTGRVQTSTIFRWIPSDDLFEESTLQSDLLQRISFEEGISMKEIKQEMESRKDFISWLQKNKIVQYNEVCDLINLYSKDRERVLSWIRKNKAPFRREADRIYKKPVLGKLSGAMTGKGPAKAPKGKARPAGLLYKTPPPPGKGPEDRGEKAARPQESEPGTAKPREKKGQRRGGSGMDSLPEKIGMIRDDLRKNIDALRGIVSGQEKGGIDVSDKLLSEEERERKDFLDVDESDAKEADRKKKPRKRIKILIPEDILPRKAAAKKKPAGKGKERGKGPRKG
jgi:flagellar protein FlaI